MCHLNPSGSENELNCGIGRFSPDEKIENWAEKVMMHYNTTQ